MAHTKRRTVYQRRRLHRLFGLLMGMPLFTVAMTGILLALKEPLSASGMLGSYDPWPFLYELHRSLFVGWSGKVFVSSLGFGLFVMVWSGSRALVRLKSRRISSHALVGLFLGVPIAIIGSLGALLNFVEPLSQWLDPIPVIGDVSPVGLSSSSPPVLKVTSEQLDRAHGVANALHDPRDLIKVYHPKPGRPFLLFYYRGNVKLYIDPPTAALLKVRSPKTHWTSALLPLHALHPLGTLGIVIMVILGTALSFLAGLGVLHLVRLGANFSWARKGSEAIRTGFSLPRYRKS